MKVKNTSARSICFVLVCLVAVAVACTLPLTRYLFYPLRYEEIVFPLADQYALDPALLYAVIKTESNFNSQATSSAGAKGLMQITDATAEYIASKRSIDRYDLFDAEDNIDFGCWYLNYLFARFTDGRTALASYNAGENTVRAWLEDASLSEDGRSLIRIPYSETARYLAKIDRSYRCYQATYPKVFSGG